LDLLKRPELGYGDIKGFDETTSVSKEVAEQVEIQAKYAGYINRQQGEIDKLRRQENTKIPDDFDFSLISGLSNEAKQKLSDLRPSTLARASRIPGVTSAAISVLLVHLKKSSAIKTIKTA
jgi:tRNA uridine 5-carboxymethylaminomethyl modification enzyme